MSEITLLNCDCMTYMKDCESNAFDLTITSPPYNIGKVHHTNKVRHTPYKDDYPEDVYQRSQINVLNECFRITKNSGSLFYNHKNRIKDGKQITPYEWLLKTKWIIKQEIVWINGTPNMDNRRFFPFTERVYWLAKDASTSLNNSAGLKDYNSWGNVGVKGGEHSRAYPLKMAEDIMYMFPNAKNIFDPYSGSGTTAISAHHAKRNFVGCELDEDYYKAACERFNNETSQHAMF